MHFNSIFLSPLLLKGLPIQGVEAQSNKNTRELQIQQSETKIPSSGLERSPLRLDRQPDDARVIELNFERRLPVKLSTDPFKHQRQLHSLFVDPNVNVKVDLPLMETEDDSGAFKVPIVNMGDTGKGGTEKRRPVTANAASSTLQQQRPRPKNFLGWDV